MSLHVHFNYAIYIYPHCFTSYSHLLKVPRTSTSRSIAEWHRFAQYNNTLLFTAANELAQLDKNGYAAFPCVKAFVRDLHNYQAECNSTMRRVPLIYSDVDTGGGVARKVVAEWLSRTRGASDRLSDANRSWCMVENGR